MKNITGIIIIAVGLVLTIYGFNHMNSTESEIKSFFGLEDKEGITFLILGGITSLIGFASVIRKR